MSGFFTRSNFKHGAIALGAAALLLSATVGFTAAQTAPTPAAQRQSVIDLAAAKLGLTSDQLSGALTQARKDLGLHPGGAVLAHVAHAELGVAAKVLGYSDAKALRKDLSGTTLAALAQTRGVPVATVSAAINADLTSRIDKLVAAGHLKPERAATLKAKLAARVDAFMNHQFK